MSKNVEAVLKWVRENRPDCQRHFEALFEGKHISPLSTITDEHHQALTGLAGLVMIGFEAGRAFQRENPTAAEGAEAYL